MAKNAFVTQQTNCQWLAQLHGRCVRVAQFTLTPLESENSGGVGARFYTELSVTRSSEWTGRAHSPLFIGHCACTRAL